MNILRTLDLERLAGVNRILGIDCSRDVVRVVELRKRGSPLNRLRAGFVPLTHFTLPRSETIPLSEGLKAALVEQKVRAKHAVVSVQSFVKTVRVTVPVSVRSIDEWIRENHEKLLRLPMSFDQISYAFEIVQQTESGATIELTFVRRSEVEELTQLVKSAGLNLIAIGLGRRDAVNTFLVDKSGAPAGKTTFFYLDSATLTKAVLTNDHRPTVTEWNVAAREEVVQIARQEHGTSVAFAGPATDAVQVSPDQIFKPFGLPSEYTLAAGLALKGFLPELSRVDVLPKQEKENYWGIIYRSLFQRSVIALGSILLGALLLPVVVDTVVQSKLESVEEELMSNPLYAQVSTLEKQVSDLNRQVSGEGSPLRRSTASKTLHEIAAATPEGVWLYKLGIDRGKMMLKGYANNSEQVSEFLKNLGRISKSVQLVRSGVPLQGEVLVPVRAATTFVTFEVTAELSGT